MDLDAEIESITSSAADAIAAAGDLKSLDDVRVSFLGKKGSLTGLLKGLGQLDADERPKAGAKINAAKESLRNLLRQDASKQNPCRECHKRRG